MTLTWESVLFVPGTRSDLVPKALATGSGVVVLDLEDAVVPQEKDQARSRVETSLAALGDADAARVFVRVNDYASWWFGADAEMVARTRAAGVVLPKYEDPAQLRGLRSVLRDGGREQILTLVGIESARGVLDCRRLFAEGPSAAYFGAEDLVADVRGRRTRSNLEVLYARSQVALTGRVEQVVTIDQAFTDFRDDSGFVRDAQEGRDLGYEGKLAIHPAQVGPCRTVFLPSSGDVAHARRVLEAGSAGVGVVDGRMVDEVHLKLARHTIALHDAVADRDRANETRGDER